MELPFKMYKAIETITQKFLRMDFIIQIVFSVSFIFIIASLIFIIYITIETEIYKDDFKIKKGTLDYFL